MADRLGRLRVDCQLRDELGLRRSKDEASAKLEEEHTRVVRVSRTVRSHSDMGSLHLGDEVKEVRLRR